MRPARVPDQDAAGRVAADLVQLPVERQVGDRRLRAAEEAMRREERVEVRDQAAQVVEQEAKRVSRGAHGRQRRHDRLREHLLGHRDLDLRRAAGHVGGDDGPVVLRVGLVQPARGEHDAHHPLVGVVLEEGVEAAAARVGGADRRRGAGRLEPARDVGRVVQGLVGRRDDDRHHGPARARPEHLLAVAQVLAHLDDRQALQLEVHADLVRVRAVRHHVERVGRRHRSISRPKLSEVCVMPLAR